MGAVWPPGVRPTLRCDYDRQAVGRLIIGKDPWNGLSPMQASDKAASGIQVHKCLQSLNLLRETVTPQTFFPRQYLLRLIGAGMFILP